MQKNATESNGKDVNIQINDESEFPKLKERNVPSDWKMKYQREKLKINA